MHVLFHVAPGFSCGGGRHWHSARLRRSCGGLLFSSFWARINRVPCTLDVGMDHPVVDLAWGRGQEEGQDGRVGWIGQEVSWGCI